MNDEAVSTDTVDTTATEPADVEESDDGAENVSQPIVVVKRNQ